MTPPPEELKAKATELLPALKEKLGTDAEGVSDATLMKFLMWKPSVDRAEGRFRDLVNWSKENPWAFASTPLMASKDDTLRRVLESEVLVAPEGITAKDGSTLMFGRLRNNDMSDGRTAEDVVRMVMYTMDRVLERESTQLHGLTIFHDMKDVGQNNIHVSIPKILFRAIFGHFPLRITAVYVLNAPLFIRGLFKVVSLTFPAKVRARMHFVTDMDAILNVIDQDNLLEEHGGKVQHDQKQWVESHIKREENGSMESLADCVKTE
ncbi:Tyrosine-protein phosphatase non-receptor type 9 [Seminavis robusta]|uniref:Tyrosine-protein phosphatase non-receptor type 9 n=1 Tax=Seminavis robusta TaxID=568900 RepID=A0A9N8HFA7_9STRA|nr:Tyrosine-protein phosphatase non-receptor type 9 [Seminavis robusta]|eukprot:Sro426_g140480.1 Tyrosine-protein phosphatase non-receptor type 9 (265) ;mRNA; f:42998-43792